MHDIRIPSAAIDHSNCQPRLIILSRDAKHYADLWHAADASGISLIVSTSEPKEVIAHPQVAMTTFLLADPDLAVQVIEYLPELAWCQSTWAGNAPLLNHPKQDYLLSGVKGIFSQLMSEYVLSYILAHVRKHEHFQKLQTQRHWQPPPITSISQLTIGIVGFGNIASGMLPVLTAFNAKVIGLSRRASTSTANAQILMYDTTAQQEFFEQSDVIVNLLPDTLNTQGYITQPLIDSLSPKARLFINAGRGSVIEDAVLLSALSQQVFTAAVLDVFSPEPLPANHVFWAHPQITITQHTAAISNPDDVMSVFFENLVRYTQGLQPLYLMNWEQGY